MTEPRLPAKPRRMGAAPVRVVAVGLLFAGVVSVPAAHAQRASPLARVEALGLDATKVGRVTAYFAPADREHAKRLAALTDEAAAYFEREFGTSFPLHLAVLDPEDWFDPWASGEPASYGSPWAWIQDALMGVPASLDEGRLIHGPDDTANLRRVQFVMLHEFGHIANKRYLHPEGPRPYSSVRWFEEFLADYFAYAFIHSSYPEWAETSRREWLDFIEGYTPPMLSLDWTFPDLPPEDRGRTYRWHHFLLNLRAASVHEEYGLDFLRQVKDRMAWDEAGEWTTESVLSTLEEFAPGFEAWAEDLENGDYLSRGQDRAPPIIDMHLHATRTEWYANGPVPICRPAVLGMRPELCPDTLWSSTLDDPPMEATIEILERRNIVAVLSGPVERVREWVAAAPERLIAAADPQSDGVPNPTSSPEALRPLFESGEFEVLAEMDTQYAGVPPNDPELEPYWAMAEELDIPVGIHMGEGPPGAGGNPLFSDYRAGLTDPFLLEDVLARHPDLRVYVMHYGSPMIDEMISMLFTYPQLYVDIGGQQWFYPRPYFYQQLQQLVDAGFGDRIMFGSDQMIWPQVIEPAIAIIEEAPFLSEEQKRDILYNNAARFLRLSEEEIARHHGR